jgi:hypothetical protein
MKVPHDRPTDRRQAHQLNQERRRTAKVHFEELVESIGVYVPAGLVVYREMTPKEIAGLLVKSSYGMNSPVCGLCR